MNMSMPDVVFDVKDVNISCVFITNSTLSTEVRWFHKGQELLSAEGSRFSFRTLGDFSFVSMLTITPAYTRDEGILVFDTVF